MLELVKGNMKSISILLGLSAGLLFGVATPFSKVLLSQLNSYQLAGLLYLGAAMVFLPYVKKRKIEFIALKLNRSHLQDF